MICARAIPSPWSALAAAEMSQSAAGFRAWVLVTIIAILHGNRLRQNPSEHHLGELRHDVMCLQVALRLIPLVNPIDHTEQGEGSGARGDGALRVTLSLSVHLNIGDQAFHEVNVFLPAGIDALAERGW